eukprot:TRINITY_DN66371_c0_g1_i1.p1 TRINITY_DN66371_c0_g1~~TRINITY_DN66371_c0_g1_i1.p1  ORF type:complete len:950 (+),score=244.47 TRINITY_DN66371_c0_g1_i1:304-2850(+)
MASVSSFAPSATGVPHEWRQQPQQPASPPPPRRLLRPAPAEGPALSTDDAFSRRLARAGLRDAIRRFSPIAVLRECLAVFQTHPEDYGPLWGLLHSEYQRLVSRDEPYSQTFWEHVTQANREFREERLMQKKEADIVRQTIAYEAELKRAHADLERSQSECARLLKKTVEVEAQIRDAEYARDNVAHELQAAKSELVRVTSRNLQLQAVYDTYIEADDKKMGETHIKLLEQSEGLKRELNAARERAQTAEASSATLEKEVARLKQLVQELTERADASVQTQRRVQAELKAVTDERDQLSSMLQEATEHDAALRQLSTDIYGLQPQGQISTPLKLRSAEAAQASPTSGDGGGSGKGKKRGRKGRRADNSPDKDAGGNAPVVTLISAVEEVGYFIGRGTGKHIPEYLRYHGKVRNRKIRKGELERLINTLWREKARYEEKMAAKVPLGNYFSIYLKQLHGNDVAVCAEHAYSIMDAAERYKADADCELFLTILKGEVPEEVYHDQMDLIQNIRVMLEAADEAAHGARTGQLTHTLVKGVLPKAIPELTPWRFQALSDALKQDYPGSAVPYAQLFVSDKDGNQGQFAEELRDQHLHMAQAYVADVCGEAALHCDEDGEISWDDIRAAWLRIDPAQLEHLEGICKQLAKAMDVPKPPARTQAELLSPHKVNEPTELSHFVPFQKFQSAFSSVFVKRRGPDPTGGDRRWNPLEASAEEGDSEPEPDDEPAQGDSSELEMTVNSLPPAAATERDVPPAALPQGLEKRHSKGANLLERRQSMVTWVAPGRRQSAAAEQSDAAEKTAQPASPVSLSPPVSPALGKRRPQNVSFSGKRLERKGTETAMAGRKGAQAT